MIRVGISGWRYAPWRGVWYPPTLVRRRELKFCGWHCPTVEINESPTTVVRNVTSSRPER